MSTMAMAPCDGDADWCHVLGDFNFNLLLCSSSSPHAMAGSRSVYWSASVSRARTSDFDSPADQVASPDGSRLSTFISSLLPDVRPRDCLPIAAAPPGPGAGGHLQRCETEVLEASSDGAFAAADCFSSALMNLHRSVRSLFQQLVIRPI